MKNWPVIAILGSAQFVMVLDGTVMNVSISTVVEDLDTTVDAGPHGARALTRFGLGRLTGDGMPQ